MVWRYGVPALLSLAGVFVALRFAPVRDSSSYYLWYVGAAAYVVGTDWLLLALRKPPSAAVPSHGRLMVSLRLLVGAPTALLLLAAIVNAMIKGDLAWDGVRLACAPVLLVWPFVLSTLRGPAAPG